MSMHSSQARADTGRHGREASSPTDWVTLEQQLCRTKTILQEILDHLQGVLRNLRAARAGFKTHARSGARPEKTGPKSGFRTTRTTAAGFGARAQESKTARPRPGHGRFERAAPGQETASGRAQDFSRRQTASAQGGNAGSFGQPRSGTAFGGFQAGDAGRKGSPYRTFTGGRTAGATAGTTAASGPDSAGGGGAAGHTQPGGPRAGFTGKTHTAGHFGAAGQAGQSFRAGQSTANGQGGASAQTGQTGQSARTGQSGFTGQSGQTGSTGQTGQTGYTGQSGQFGQSGQSGQTGGPYARTNAGQSRQREGFGQTSRPGQSRTSHSSNAYDTRRETGRPEGAARHRFSGERQERGRQAARHSGMNLKCAYDILCLDYPCTPVEIKDAYRGMARKFHPDLGGDEEVMKDVNLAYELAMRFCAGPRRSGASWSS